MDKQQCNINFIDNNNDNDNNVVFNDKFGDDTCKMYD